ncbi:MAG: hypothetical protein KC572_12265 [Gammaproteobacteria bacterium]|nr:hypothetical protein [Gammaproteobacteria bacterium]
MTPKIRSFSGAALMLVIIPIIAGLLACMPVPIGDPERSRVDPGLNGAWVLQSDGDLGVYQFLPWDQRSWLILATGIEAGDEFEGELPALKTPEDYAAALENFSIGKDGITARSVTIYKVWLAKIGGERFMTWEGLGPADQDGRAAPESWFVFKVTKNDANQYELLMLNGESDLFDDIPLPKEYDGDDYASDMRRKFERVIKRNANNEELYVEDAFLLFPLSEDAQEAAFDLFGEVMDME